MKAVYGLCIIIFLLCVVAGCKKDAAKNVVEGNWKVVNVTGKVTSSTGADSGTYTYSYNPADSLLSYTAITTSHPLPLTTNQTIFETWNFISADTCTVTSTYAGLTSGELTGSWNGAYTLQNSLLFLASGTSKLLALIGIDSPPYAGNYDQFNIQSVSSNQMVLNYNTVVNDSNSVAQVNFTFTFGK